MIQLQTTHIDAIKQQAESEYPFECCGLLIGIVSSDNRKSVHHILPISNARDTENKHNRFLITPQDLLKGELFARKHTMDILGFYHSHPDHPAVPSPYDLDHAWPVYSYIIVAVEKSIAQEITSWTLEHDRSKFNTETIEKGE
ncbi:MAG TPA: M67 family metallopeptidase [Negativicutes bacterium]|nr:M67 family metallopeptidase [Negativicutes bacterium]